VLARSAGVTAAEPRDEFGVGEATAVEGYGETAHPVGGVEASGVVSAAELGDVPVQVAGAHLVVGAVVAALEDRPEAFGAVGVAGAVDVLAAAVVHGPVPGQAGVGTRRARNLGARFVGHRGFSDDLVPSDSQRRAPSGHHLALSPGSKHRRQVQRG